MAIAFRSQSSLPSSTATAEVAIDAPAGLQAGDIMIAFLGTFNDPGTVTVPTGWNQVGGAYLGGGAGAAWSSVYVKVAGSSEPSTYSWSWVNTVNRTLGIAAYSGGDGSNPIDAHSSQNSATSSTIFAPGVAISAGPKMMVAAFTVRGQDIRQITPNDDLVERFDLRSQGGTSGVVICLADKPVDGGPSGSTTSTVTGTITGGAFSGSNANNNGRQIILNEGAAAPPSVKSRSQAVVVSGS